MSELGFLLQTQRLGLRAFRAEDLEDLESMLGDAETMKFYSNPFTRKMCSSWIRAIAGATRRMALMRRVPA